MCCEERKDFLQELVAELFDRGIFSFRMLSLFLENTGGWAHSSATFGLFFQSLVRVIQGFTEAVQSLYKIRLFLEKGKA